MSNRSLFGFLLVLIGAAFILNSYFNIFEGFSSWWPLLIIVIGLIQLIKRSSILSGLTIMAVGFLFLGKNLEWIPSELVFPIALILVGCWFIFSRLVNKTRQEDTDRINYFTLFSGLETNNQSKDFKGGSITAVFGGSEVNLRDAQLSDQGVQLELTAVFGGVEIAVPKHWKVHITGTPIFGGWENKAVYRSENADGEAPILRVNCTTVFGGATIKN
mgnify:CR=1 FL=1